MVETNIPEINVEEIMARIREEVKLRKQRTAAHDNEPSPISSNTAEAFKQLDGEPEIPLHSCPALAKCHLETAAPPFPGTEAYALNELLIYHDTDFITNAYAAILHRSPDHNGAEHYLTNLRNGELTKAEILGRLRYSREGRSRKIPVKGLLFPFLTQSSYKIPILGKGLRILTGLLNLPTILKNIQVVENTLFIKSNIFNDQIKTMHSHLHILRDHVAGMQDEIASRLHNKAYKQDITAVSENISVIQSGMKEELGRITEKLAAGEANFMDNISQLSENISFTKNSLIDQERRLALFLNEARKRLPEPFSREQLENLVSEEDHLHDAMYVAFEDHFRGTREDIKERQKVYLPYIEKVMQQTGGGEILDVGCGRGEWLELLKEKEYKAKGVDINRVMVSECADMALDVVESDVIEYLRAQKANSFFAITGFHIVEHLPNNILIKLFDESLRVLRSGGIIIFETPNPENIIVGSCNFYIDPSHCNPIPPITLKFIAEARGFNNAEIVRLYENEYYSELKQSNISEKITSLFYSAQDYSIIGHKA
ncbi:MAG: methyltransferase domain-containing protein [Desulfosarcina sp.]|nr:methyltransferase domain-containing protein [Desulfobacterales bacterium]